MKELLREIANEARRISNVAVVTEQITKPGDYHPELAEEIQRYAARITVMAERLKPPPEPKP